MALLLEDEEQEIINFKTAVFQYKCDNFYHPEADGVSFRKPTRPSLPLRKAPPLTPTLSPSGEREETAPPRRSEPLRSKVGGASKPSPCCAGWDRRGNSSLQLIVYSFLIFVVIC